MKNEFSLSDLVVIKSEDKLNDEELSKIIGGAKKQVEASACPCKCTLGNCYEDT
jgi:bacteriocin-like protein